MLVPRKGMEVDILFAGNTMAVSDEFYEYVGKEYRMVVLKNESAKEKQRKKNLLFFRNTCEEDTERIFRTFDFETVVFFSQVLDGE